MTGAELSFAVFTALALGGALVALFETSVVRSAFAMFGTKGISFPPRRVRPTHFRFRESVSVRFRLRRWKYR